MGQRSPAPAPSFAGSLPRRGLGGAGARERGGVSSAGLCWELQGGGAEGPLRPHALLLAFLVPGRPYSRVAHPPPACAVSSLPLFAPGQASWICGTSVVGGEGEVARARLGGQTRRTLEVRVQGRSLGCNRGNGDVPSNLMTQHHLGRLVAAPALLLRANQTHSSF